MGNVVVCKRRRDPPSEGKGDTTEESRPPPVTKSAMMQLRLRRRRHASAASETETATNRDAPRVPPLRELQAFVPPIARGTVVKVYDGDTITVAAPLPNEDGVPTYYKFSVRLRGIDCPELRTRNEVEKAVAIVARDTLQARILHQEVELKERATDKYGRLLANVYYRGDQHEPELGQWLLTQRLAVPYDGGTKTVVDNWQLYHQSASGFTLSSPR